MFHHDTNLPRSDFLYTHTSSMCIFHQHGKLFAESAHYFQPCYRTGTFRASSIQELEVNQTNAIFFSPRRRIAKYQRNARKIFWLLPITKLSLVLSKENQIYQVPSWRDFCSAAAAKFSSYCSRIGSRKFKIRFTHSTYFLS